MLRLKLVVYFLLMALGALVHPRAALDTVLDERAGRKLRHRAGGARLGERA